MQRRFILRYLNAPVDVQKCAPNDFFSNVTTIQTARGGNGESEIVLLFSPSFTGRMKELGEKKKTPKEFPHTSPQASRERGREGGREAGWGRGEDPLGLLLLFDRRGRTRTAEAAAI